MSNLNQNKMHLCFGPMSPEAIEAVFRYSNFKRRPLMLIASKNQIDYNGGYVNNWTTKEYMDFVKKMKDMYTDSDVKICRDHCGPGFNGNGDLEDVYKTLKADIENGFDLIHIDFCHFKGPRDEMLQASKKAVEYCLSLNPNIEFEIGTDENAGTNYSIANLDEIEEEIDFFKDFCNPRFYVVQTGSLVMEINQVGNFNKDFVKKISEVVESKGLTMKEHNADYLTQPQIQERKGIVKALNNAPQLGVVQTSTVLTKCLMYGIDYSKFFDIVIEGGKWKKWLKDNTPDNKMLCFLIAGHYHFGSLEYKEIIEQLNEKEEIEDTIVHQIMEVIEHYDI